MSEKKVIMFFGAHADDMELRAAGTMAKLIAKGYHGVSVMMTNNICGAYATDEKGDRHPLGPFETMEIRHREVREAAEVLGVELVFLDFKENSYYKDGNRVFFGTPEYDQTELPGREPLVAAPYLDHCVRDVADVLVKYSPDIVITHSIANCNPEHCAAAHLTYNAFRIAVRETELGALWFNASRQGTGDVLMLSPDIVIDITNYIEIKREAMARHVSQGLVGGAIEELVRSQGEWWGRVAGVKRAEAFKTVMSGRLS